MSMGQRAILDRTAAAADAPTACDPGPEPVVGGSTPARRSSRARGIMLALVIAGGMGTAWLALRPRPDPDRLWADAERAFLAGHRDRARDALKTLEGLRPKTALDRPLEAQLATAEGRFDEALATIARIPDAH